VSEYENWFSVRFPNIQATIDQSNDQESKLLKLACKEVWQHQQAEIDDLRSQLNNMERCYIEKKKQVEACSALVGQWREKRMGGCSDYARGGLHSRQDCTDDLEKALRGEHE